MAFTETEERLAESKIPAGYSQIKDGKIQPGDKVWDWKTATFEDVAEREVGDHAVSYIYAVRKENK